MFRVDKYLNSLNYKEAKKLLDSLSEDKLLEKSKGKILLELKYSQYYYMLKDFSNAYSCLINAEKVCYSWKESKYIPLIYMKKSIIFKQLGDNDLSIELSESAYSIAQEINDRQSLLKIKYSRFVLEQDPVEKALEKGEKISDSLIAHLIDMHNRFVKIFEQYQGQFKEEYVKALFNRAIFYSFVKPDSAVLLFQDVTRLCQLENRVLPLCNGYSFIGESYYKIKNYEKSKEYLFKSLAISTKIKDYEVSIKNYTTLYMIEKLNGNVKIALMYLEQIVQMNSILESRHKSGFSLITKQIREISQNELKIKKLEHEQYVLKEKEQSNRLLLIAILLGSIFILFSIFLFSINIQRKQKLRAIKKDQEIFQLEITQLELKNQQSKRELEARTEGYETAQEFIARELHDQVANSIGALKLMFENSIKKSNFDIKSKLFLKYLDDIYNKVRNLSHNMYIPDDDQTDIVGLFDNFAAELQESKNMKISYSIYPEDGMNEMSSLIKKELFLILRELLINITKHSNAIEVDLNINKFESEVQILLSDNGIIDPSKNTNGSGLGVKNIEWRTENLGGKFEVLYNEKIGTQWHMTIPL